MIKCLREAHLPEWMAKGKHTLTQKDPHKRTIPKQPQTHNLPTYGVDNTNDANKGRNILLANKSRILT